MRGASTHSIFGREIELGAIRAELSAAMQGAGRLILLAGEPGIGKTTLVAAHALEAQARGSLVLWGRCHEMPGAPAYWPFIQVLEALHRFAGQLPEGIVEELQALRESLRAESARDASAPVEEHTLFELFARIARALSLVAEKRGLVIVIDDLHWADLVSVRLLRFLASELSADAILMIATLRTHEAATDATLTELARLARNVPVGPLERPAVAALLAERLPDAGRPSPGEANPAAKRDAFLEAVFERSDGNPFFVLELAHLLLSGPTELRRAGASLPGGVKKVLEQRLSPLPEATRSLLQAASVIGREFDLVLLARVMESDRAALVAPLRPAIDLGVVHAVPDTLHRFSFAHALTRETLYESLDEEESARLHGRVGVALEAEPRAEQLSAMAHHFFLAAREAGPGKAARYGFEAGSQLLALVACEEAATHFRRTLSLLGDDGADDMPVRARVGLGQALLGMGDRAGAEPVLKEAVDRAAARGDALRFAEAVLSWATAREEIGVIDRESNTFLESALEQLPGDVSALRARLLARLSSGLHLEPGSKPRQRALAEEAMRMALVVDDPATTGFVQVRRIACLLGPDRLEERVAATAEMLRSSAGHSTPELNALTFQLDTCAELGDRRGLDIALDAFAQKARSVRHPYFIWNAANHRAAMALAEGRYEDAEANAVEALTLGQRVQERTPMLQFAQQMFMLRGWQNRLTEIAPLVEGGVEATRVVPAWHCALADLYNMLGRREDARREFDAVAVDDFASLPLDSTWLTSMVLLSSVCCRTGDTKNAPTLYRLLRPYAGRIAIGTPLVVMVGVIDTRLGQLASLLGLYDDAERHFAAAMELAERMRALPWQADVRYYRAEMLRARSLAGDAELSEALLDEAGTIARSVGMALLTAWIEALRSAEPEPREAGVAVARSESSGTFRREGELFIVAFEGRTARVRSMVGLTYIQELLSNEGCEVRALDLVAAAQGREAGDLPGDAGPALDPRARKEYQTRLRDLREELALAERQNDRGRTEQLSHELEFLTAELARGFGLGGRSRTTGSATERARISVTRAIRNAIRKIAEYDDSLAQHLQRDIRTGTYCVYSPSDRDRVSWKL